MQIIPAGRLVGQLCNFSLVSFSTYDEAGDILHEYSTTEQPKLATNV